MDDLENAYDWIDDVSTKILGNFIKTTFLIDNVFEIYYKKIGLSKTQFYSLYVVYLAGEEGLTLSDLGNKMRVTKANITSLVDRMENYGYFIRINNPNDRRSIKTIITEEGRRVLSEVLPEYKKFSSEIMTFLSSEEKNVANLLLEKIQKYLLQIYFA